MRTAIGGAGLATVPEPFAREALANGRLESVLDDWLTPFDGFQLHDPGR